MKVERKEESLETREKGELNLSAQRMKKRRTREHEKLMDEEENLFQSQ